MASNHSYSIKTPLSVLHIVLRPFAIVFQNFRFALILILSCFDVVLIQNPRVWIIDRFICRMVVARILAMFGLNKL